MSYEYKQIKKLRAMVNNVLEWVPGARNNDTCLMIEVWKRYFPDLLNNLNESVCFRQLYHLPMQDDVSRIRRKIQQEGKWPPTRPEIAMRRGMSMDEWRIACGYPTVQSTGTEHPSWTPPSERKPPQPQESLL